MTSTGLADHCEEAVHVRAFIVRPCHGKGLLVNVHPDGVTRKVMCSTHSRKAFLSGYGVDWDESKRVFGTGMPKGRRADGIDRGQW